ncbi:MAG: HAD family phosphatase [Nanoarchaeota archaeon]|nr:HAD family phosphatase [Nanoarchaeota archaeon]
MSRQGNGDLEGVSGRMIAVIFDMDGVMIDNNKYHKKSWKAFCKKYGFDLSDDNLKKHVYGKINSEIHNYLFGKEISAVQSSEYTQEKEKIYRDLFENDIKPVNGLLDFLEQLHQHKILRAIATSAPPVNVEWVIEKIGIGKYFTVIVDDTMVNKGKPNPEVFLKASRALKVDPSLCVVFEDSLSGVDAAINAGMKVIAITTTHTKDELSKADLVIDDFTEVDVDKVRLLL